jgi:hypothetical protein
MSNEPSQQGQGKIKPDSPDTKCKHGNWKVEGKAIYCNLCSPLIPAKDKEGIS